MNKPNLLEDKPIVNADENLWGLKLNKIIDKLQTFVNNVVDSLQSKLDKGSVSDDYSTAEKIEQKITTKLDKNIYDVDKTEIDKHISDYSTFKENFQEGNYLRFTTTKNLEDKSGIVKELNVENIVINNINGEPYSKSNNISEQDIKTIGDKYYEPKFDKKTGWNLDISSDINSNADNVIVSTRLLTTQISNINGKLNDKVSSSTLETKLSTKVDKQSFQGTIKNLILEDNKLKYKESNGQTDMNKEIVLPQNNGQGGNTSELDAWWTAKFNENNNAQGVIEVGIHYQDYEQLKKGYYNNVSHYPKLYWVGKNSENNTLTHDELGNLALSGLRVSSIVSTYEKGNFNISQYEYLRVNNPKSYEADTKYFSRSHGAIKTFNTISSLPMNNLVEKHSGAPGKGNLLFEVPNYIPINNYLNGQVSYYRKDTPIYTLCRGNLQTLLGASTPIEENKIYITVGYYYISDKNEISISNLCYIMPISEHKNDLPYMYAQRHIPNYFYCLCYFSQDALNYVPLIGHTAVKKAYSSVIYTYLEQLYSEETTWAYDKNRNIVQIIPVGFSDKVPSTVGTEQYNIPSKIRLENNSFLDLERKPEVINSEETAHKYGFNKHYGYIYWFKDEEMFYIMSELKSWEILNENRLYISKTAYENVGTLYQQVKYKEEYIKKALNGSSNSSGTENNYTNLLQPMEDSDKSQAYQAYDTWTNKVVKIDETIGKQDTLSLGAERLSLPRYLYLTSWYNLYNTKINIELIKNINLLYYNKLNELISQMENDKLYSCNVYFTVLSNDAYPVTTLKNLDCLPDLLSISGTKSYPDFSKINNIKGVIWKETINNQTSLYIQPFVDSFVISEKNNPNLFNKLNTLLGDKDSVPFSFPTNSSVNGILHTEFNPQDFGRNYVLSITASLPAGVEYSLAPMYVVKERDKNYNPGGRYIYVLTYKNLSKHIYYSDIPKIAFFPCDDVFKDRTIKQNKSMIKYRNDKLGKYMEIPDVNASIYLKTPATQFINMQGEVLAKSYSITDWKSIYFNAYIDNDLCYKLTYTQSDALYISGTNFVISDLKFCILMGVDNTTNTNSKFLYFYIHSYQLKDVVENTSLEFGTKRTISNNTLSLQSMYLDYSNRKQYSLSTLSINLAQSSTNNFPQNTRGVNITTSGFGTEYANFLTEYFTWNTDNKNLSYLSMQGKNKPLKDIHDEATRELKEPYKSILQPEIGLKGQIGIQCIKDSSLVSITQVLSGLQEQPLTFNPDVHS